MRRLVLDIETTGLSPVNNQILTVGMVMADFNKNRFKVVNSQHIKIKHDKYKVSGIALKINKINLKDHHKEGVSSESAIDMINEFYKKNYCDNHPVLGHNLMFDLRFLENLYKTNNQDLILGSEYIDTMILWRELRNRGVVPGHLKASLKVLAKYFNVDYQNAHNAVSDCHITAEVYHKLINLNKIREVE